MRPMTLALGFGLASLACAGQRPMADSAPELRAQSLADQPQVQTGAATPVPAMVRVQQAESASRRRNLQARSTRRWCRAMPWNTFFLILRP